MSEQEVVLEEENKKLKKKRWQQIIDAAREALEKNDNTKKGIIKKTAELLEKNGMPLEMICGTISREFHGFASKNYITECLDSKYKDMAQSHPTPTPTTGTGTKPEVGNVTLPDDAKNVIEQSSESDDDEIDIIVRPEDYIVEDLQKYSSQLKNRIIIYLDEEVKRLTNQQGGSKP